MESAESKAPLLNAIKPPDTAPATIPDAETESEKKKFRQSGKSAALRADAAEQALHDSLSNHLAHLDDENQRYADEIHTLRDELGTLKPAYAALLQASKTNKLVPFQLNDFRAF